MMQFRPVTTKFYLIRQDGKVTGLLTANTEQMVRRHTQGTVVCFDYDADRPERSDAWVFADDELRFVTVEPSRAFENGI